MFYAVLADVLTAFHTGYVGFVVLGELAILFGTACGCRWARNPWFRGAHLLAIAFAVDAVLHIPCPLTTWEYKLRGLAGQAGGADPFLGRLMHRMFVDGAFPDWAYKYLHLGWGGLVLATFVVLPPRWRGRGVKA